jgi:hypothetical protein
MKKLHIVVALQSIFIVGIWGQAGSAIAKSSKRQAVGMPRFEVDPSWPKLPGKWAFGLVSGVYVDPQDHVWALYRPGSVPP